MKDDQNAQNTFQEVEEDLVVTKQGNSYVISSIAGTVGEITYKLIDVDTWVIDHTFVDSRFQYLPKVSMEIGWLSLPITYLRKRLWTPKTKELSTYKRLNRLPRLTWLYPLLKVTGFQHLN